MLRSALGPRICGWLDDPDICEVMLNPDGRVWLDRLGSGLWATDLVLRPAEGERVIRLAAHHAGREAHPGAPRVSAELPGGGERFEGLLPPVTAGPAFAIRKAAGQALRLADYVAQGVMSGRAADALAAAVASRANILVAGPTSSGKTTLANALLAEPALAADRVVILEDVRELRCPAPNSLALRVADPGVSMAALVRSALRLRPDRIVVGEVRGGEALDLLKAWATGHPGGVGTVHAGSAAGALARLEHLVQEVAAAVPRGLIAEAVQVVAVLAGRGAERRLVELARVAGPAPDGWRLEPLAGGAG
ncbi:P-type conjugative transfer ATPase TrbB [Phenylobacterium sp.]|uniref:P-type conjugative transfer ATPase TrbB n=1 Tax=Phenylobacterium sp. TaxID=1871053 RepID=UPI0035B13B70